LLSNKGKLLQLDYAQLGSSAQSEAQEMRVLQKNTQVVLAIERTRI
jgi:hypothetical protein